MEGTKTGSESEQMYLVSIARLSEMIDECPIPISKVAEILDVTPISANQMVHNLEQMKLITYTPYKGVEFTEAGWLIAIKVLRRRRLWEVFLVEHLQYKPDEVETLACRLEHAISDETADRLAEYLGWPQVSPKGKPISQSHSGDKKLESGVTLSSLSAGTTGTVIAILAREAEKVFLEQAGINIGCPFKILASQQNAAYLIKYGDDLMVNLVAELAQKILVKPTI